jgi:hypothetical protein
VRFFSKKGRHFLGEKFLEENCVFGWATGEKYFQKNNSLKK